MIQTNACAYPVDYFDHWRVWRPDRPQRHIFGRYATEERAQRSADRINKKLGLVDPRQQEAIYQTALDDFSAALAKTPPAEVEAARTGCGLGAARFACRYVKPGEDQVLYRRIYDIFWNHYHQRRR